MLSRDRDFPGMVRVTRGARIADNWRHGLANCAPARQTSQIGAPIPVRPLWGARCRQESLSGLSHDDRSGVAVRDEGLIEIDGGRVWFARLGKGRATPVLVLHGGPGAGHEYLAALTNRLSGTRPVIVFDQLGCGRSDRPQDDSLWTLERAVSEVDAVRTALGLDECHLFGHSWGGWLSIEYVTRGTTGIAGLVLASASASMPQFVAEVNLLVDRMPEPHRSVLVELGEQGLYADPSYVSALDAFYRRHLCRLDPWPDVLIRSVEQEGENRAYEIMSGPNDVVVTGSLRYWNREPDLDRIEARTLVTCGRHDEVTPACSATLAAGIRDAQLVLFEDSGHLAHLEQADEYAHTVRSFLETVDAG
jgi:proline-specific peptidase